MYRSVATCIQIIIKKVGEWGSLFAPCILAGDKSTVVYLTGSVQVMGESEFFIWEMIQHYIISLTAAEYIKFCYLAPLIVYNREWGVSLRGDGFAVAARLARWRHRYTCNTLEPDRTCGNSCSRWFGLARLPPRTSEASSLRTGVYLVHALAIQT